MHTLVTMRPAALRWRVRAVVILAAAMSGSGCGAARDAPSVLGDATRATSMVSSGRLDLQVQLTAADRRSVGLHVTGTFALAVPGRLPIADIAVSRLPAGGGTGTLRIVSTGERAYQLQGTQAIQLGEQDAARLARDGGRGVIGGATGLHFDQWFVNPQRSDGPQRDGVSTDQVRGSPDIVAVLSDLLPTLGLQAGFAQTNAAALRQAATNTHAELAAATGDHIARHVEAGSDFGGAIGGEARKALGALAGGHFTMSLDLNEVNQPITVSTPPNAMLAPPSPALPAASAMP